MNQPAQWPRTLGLVIHVVTRGLSCSRQLISSGCPMSHTFASYVWPLEPKEPRPTVILLFTCVHGLQASNSEKMEDQTPVLEEKANRTILFLLGKPHTKTFQTQRVENPRSQGFGLTILQICQSRREGTMARGPHPGRSLRLTLFTGLALSQQ